MSLHTKSMNDPPRSQPADRDAAATYIAALSAELAFLARRFGLTALGYILEMARLEAENARRPGAGKPP